MIEVRGRLLRRPYVVQAGPRATLIRADLFFRIFEDGVPVMPVPITIDYRAEWFEGITDPQEALRIMKLDGIGGRPSWHAVRDGLRDDWEASGTIRSIPETEF